jgi:hypothetical protein
MATWQPGSPGGQQDADFRTPQVSKVDFTSKDADQFSEYQQARLASRWRSFLKRGRITGIESCSPGFMFEQGLNSDK